MGLHGLKSLCGSVHAVASAADCSTVVNYMCKMIEKLNIATCSIKCFIVEIKNALL